LHVFNYKPNAKGFMVINNRTSATEKIWRW